MGMTIDEERAIKTFGAALSALPRELDRSATVAELIRRLSPEVRDVAFQMLEEDSSRGRAR
jgi:hypothetical protein